MPVTLTDAQIATLLIEEKQLPQEYKKLIQVKPKGGHKECELDLKSIAGNEFRLILRQNSFNPLDFSVILAYRPPATSQLFRLKRYNGKSHEHTNKLEKETFYDYHIHCASERYQASGLREDAYAVVTDRYTDLSGALDCMLKDCGFVVPQSDQIDLFRGQE